MKLCFHFEAFDKDVSSGTFHSASQWHEMCMAFNVDEIAVINLTDETFPQINDSIKITEYDSINNFIEEHSNITFIEHGGEDYREYDYSDTEWLVIGGYAGLDKADVALPTSVALYPREAAAIVLARVIWEQ